MMANKTQLLKGILEGCILKIINEKETYGYEIVEKLKSYGLEDTSEGSIYPLLIRLEKNEFLNSTMKDSPFGPKRKYYSLSTKGKEELESFKGAWDYLSKVVNNIMED